MTTSAPPPAAKRGRPPLGDKAMAPKERQQAYRERQQLRAQEAVVRPEEASRVTLLETLAACLERLDNYEGRSKVLRENMRHGAEGVLREVARRYGLKFP